MSLKTTSLREMQDALAAGETLPLVPLALGMESCATEVEMNENFYATLERGYKPINDYLWKESGAISLVGAGPSIGKTYTEFVGDVCAINSAIGFLLDKGIVPKYAMLWDAADIVAEFAVPHPDITYLVASRCHPNVFERLAGCNIVVWHANGDHNILEVMNRPDVIAKQPIPEPLINGGSAGITRGIYLVNNLGYRDIHIFGGDSSYSGDKTHVNGSLVPEKDIVVSVGNDPPSWFRTTPEWCAQVEEYKSIFTVFCAHEGNTLQVHGDGMLRVMHDKLVEKLEAQGKEKFIASMIKNVTADHNLNELASKAFEANNPQPLETNHANAS